MARYLGPSCRLCRRERVQLYLKGTRCYTDKCAIEKRKTLPGQHGAQKSKLSDYGVQMREKQKLKRIYGLLERQMRRFYNNASHARGQTGALLIQNLEMRLDSIVYRLGYGISRNAARELVRHNHVLVNGKRCNIPSALLKIGDTISLVAVAQQMPTVLLAIETAKREGHKTPSWLQVDYSNFTGSCLLNPIARIYKFLFVSSLLWNFVPNNIGVYKNAK